MKQAVLSSVFVAYLELLCMACKEHRTLPFSHSTALNLHTHSVPKPSVLYAGSILRHHRHASDTKAVLKDEQRGYVAS